MSFDGLFRSGSADKTPQYTTPMKTGQEVEAQEPMNPSERLTSDRRTHRLALAKVRQHPQDHSHGAGLPDPDKLFNAGLGGSAWRAIDFFEGDKIHERALKNLVRAAVDYNQIELKRKAPAGT